MPTDETICPWCGYPQIDCGMDCITENYELAHGMDPEDQPAEFPLG